jgi:hypothetical protein
MQVQSQGRHPHSGGYQQPINSDINDSIAHRGEHRGRTFRQERLREMKKKGEAAETRRFSFALAEGDFPNPADGKK